MLRRIIITFVWSGLLYCPIFGQFYNGLGMNFGKSRVQYNEFYWSFYRYPKYDVYFYEDGMQLAEYTGRVAEQKLTVLQSTFDYLLEKRILFLVYNRMSDFRQENIGLITGNDEYNTGGVTRIINNKIFLYYEGDHKSFDEQISMAMAETLINEMIFGNKIGENITNSSVLVLPDWFSKGLVSYAAIPWNEQIEDHVKDGITSGKYKQINRLTGTDAMYAGHSFWQYISKTYGEKAITDILYYVRIQKNINKSFINVLGSRLKDLSAEWLSYYTKQYAPVLSGDSLMPKMINKPRLCRPVYQQARLSPDGKYLAYVTNEMGRYKIWLYQTATGQRKRIFMRGHKLDQITDYSYPVLGWHPGSNLLVFFIEDEGQLRIGFYNIASKELNIRYFQYLDKVNSFCFSPDGTKIVLSGDLMGNTDIFVHALASGTNEQITYDEADDMDPRFIDSGTGIIFSSNRNTDTLSANPKAGNAFNLYLYNYANHTPVLQNLTNQPYTNNRKPYEASHHQYIFLSNANGIVNRYVALFDSAISYIDTTAHYRYFSHVYPLSDYKRNIVDHDIIAPTKQTADISLVRGHYGMYLKQLSEQPLNGNLSVLPYRTEYLKHSYKLDSLQNLFLHKTDTNTKHIAHRIFRALADSIFTDTMKVDIGHYVFEKEKADPLSVYIPTENPVIIDDTTGGALNKIRIYLLSFYPNYLVNQVDFNFLNSSYQVFNGGSAYYNPGMNLTFKVGANDLFEDYKITGGVSFATSFDSNEFLLSFENLKKRLDKQWVFHRQAYKELLGNDTLTKTHMHELMYILKYPFSQVTSVKTTFSFRHDRTTFLSTSLANLARENIYRLWAGVKVEYIFDNTRYLGINTLAGTRYKLFGEAFKQVNKSKTQLFVLGFDFRHYEPLHRNLIWASRFAVSSSFGTARLLYYLGGVDNWYYQLSNTTAYDNSVPINHQETYAYQAIATNMRGFIQNIRNGNNFFVINNEIRWPFVKYFLNYPVGSNFLSSLQAVGFFDVGSAWTGITPYSGKNSYDKQEIKADENGNIVVTLDSNRDPIVEGFGYGLRAQLLGYFMRFDWAWGIENRVILPRLFYFSLSLDF